MRAHPRRQRGGRKKLLIAFRAYKEGIWNAQYAAGRGDVLWNTRVKDDQGHDVFIRRGDVPRYMTDYFWSCLHLWVLTENLGTLPFGGGWADNPHEIVQVVNALRVASSQYDEEQRERRSAHDAEMRRTEK